jgi:uncharacterized protein (TIGR02145 family)
VKTPLGLDHGLLEEIHGTSAKLDKSAFESWSAQTEHWDIDEYTGGDGIRVDDHEISVSGKYLTSDDLNPYATSSWVEDNFLNKADYREYSEGNDYVRIDDHKIYGYDWTSAVSGVPFKLDASAFAEYSAYADRTYLKQDALEPYATSAGLDPDQQYAMTDRGWAPVDIPDETVVSGTSGISVQKIGDTWVVGTSAQFATSAWVQDELDKKQDVTAMSAYATSAWVDESFQQKGDYITPDELETALEPYATSSQVNEGLAKKVDVTSMSAYATSAWVEENFLTETDLGNVVSSLYDRTATYEVNDYVIHDKKLYRCNTAIGVAEEWNALHWTAVKSTDSFEGSAPGLVPAAESGDADKVLKGDGTWGEAGSSVRVSYDSVTEELHMDFSPIPTSVTIGDKEYQIVQIGNQYWMEENLALDISGSITNAEHPEFGRYYNYSQMDAIPCPQGWRLATYSDLQSLDSNASHLSNRLLVNGDLGFNAMLCGEYYSNSNTWDGVGSSFSIWSSTEYAANNRYGLTIRPNNPIQIGFSTDTYRPVRLVKDA